MSSQRAVQRAESPAQRYLEELSLLTYGRRVRRRGRILEEVADHLREAAHHHCLSGASPYEAELAAVRDFGDPRLLAKGYRHAVAQRLIEGVLTSMIAVMVAEMAFWWFATGASLPPSTATSLILVERAVGSATALLCLFVLWRAMRDSRGAVPYQLLKCAAAGVVIISVGLIALSAALNLLIPDTTWAAITLAVVVLPLGLTARRAWIGWRLISAV